jgi:hypothetical protein
VYFRYEGAGAWHDVERITRVSGRGVDAEVVLEVQVRLAQPVVIAKDTAFGHKTVLQAGPEQANESSIVSLWSSAGPEERTVARRSSGRPLHARRNGEPAATAPLLQSSRRYHASNRGMQEERWRAWHRSCT